MPLPRLKPERRALIPRSQQPHLPTGLVVNLWPKGFSILLSSPIMRCQRSQGRTGESERQTSASPPLPPMPHNTNGECDAMRWAYAPLSIIIIFGRRHRRRIVHAPHCASPLPIIRQNCMARQRGLPPRSHHSWNLQNRRSPCHYHSSKNSTLVVYSTILGTLQICIPCFACKFMYKIALRTGYM